MKVTFYIFFFCDFLTNCTYICTWAVQDESTEIIYSGECFEKKKNHRLIEKMLINYFNTGSPN